MADRSVPESGKNRVALGEFDQAVEARPRPQRRRFSARQTTQGKALTGKEQSCPGAIGQFAGYAFGPSPPRINSCRPDGTSLQRKQDQAMGRSSCDTSRPRPPAIVPVSLCVPRRRDSGIPKNLRPDRTAQTPEDPLGSQTHAGPASPRSVALEQSAGPYAPHPTSTRCCCAVERTRPLSPLGNRWKTTPWSCS